MVRTCISFLLKFKWQCLACSAMSQLWLCHLRSFSFSSVYGLWTNNFVPLIELNQNEWLLFNVVALSGLAVVYALNTVLGPKQSCKWSPFSSARSIQGLGFSFHRFLSLALILCGALRLFIAIIRMMFLSLMTLILDADLIASLTSQRLHRMGRSIPAYLLIFLMFSLPLAPMWLIIAFLTIPWLDLIWDKVGEYLPEHSSWDDVTVLADDLIALQGLSSWGNLDAYWLCEKPPDSPRSSQSAD